MELALVAPFGLIIGSFLNVVAYRLPRGESLVKPRSRCTSCGEEVRAYDNVPVLSWLALRGRCRHCHAGISPRYPAVELVTAILFAAVVAVHGLDERLALELPFAAMLLAVASIDLEHRIVPNRILLPFAVWGVAAAAVVRPHDMPELLGAGTGAFALLLLAALAHPGGMGMGDVKLAGVMGIFLGASVIPALAIAFLAGSVVGVAIIVRKGGAARKVGVPFAPFMALGGVVGLLAGPELIHLYVHTFLH
jgi:leader peptidase (prepilin peptidase) / N-methyltransferase